MARLGRTSLFVVALVATTSCDRTPTQPLARRVFTPPDASANSAPTIDIFPDEYFSGIVFPGACASFTVTVRDELGNIVDNAVVTWTVADSRVAYFDNNDESGWTGQGAALVCGQGNGFGYSDISASWTSPTSPHPTATDSRPIEYGQTNSGYQPQSVAVTPASKDLYPGEIELLTATGTDQFGHIRQVLNDYINWSSNNPSAATVTYNGTVTAVAAGSATITADVHGTTGTSSIFVLGVGSMTVTPNPITVCLNGPVGANATPRDTRGNVWPNGVIAWSSSNSSIATVTYNSGQGNSGHRIGEVYGVAEGQANAIATLDGVSGSSPITVVYCAPRASVVGPYTVNLYQWGRFTATASVGVPPYTYEFRRMDCPVSEFGCQPWGVWYARGSTNYWDTNVYSCNIQHIYVQARVTDSRGTVSGPSGSWKTYINNPC